MKKFIALFSSLFIVDRLTKILALSFLSGRDIKIFPGLNLSLVWNKGVSWGFFSYSSKLGFYLLTAIIFLVIVGFFIYTIDIYMSGRLVFFETFILAGAVSNFFDRIYYGAVIDFIDFHICRWHWPTFNFADAFIVIGIGGIIGRALLSCALQKK
jgi:signal peptidase II